MTRSRAWAGWDTLAAALAREGWAAEFGTRPAPTRVRAPAVSSRLHDLLNLVQQRPLGRPRGIGGWFYLFIYFLQQVDCLHSPALAKLFKTLTSPSLHICLCALYVPGNRIGPQHVLHSIICDK